jgi:hypothetical protein
MRANLFVLASDWRLDGLNPDQALPGSVSYCGKLGSPYPDKRPMGFPFDRVTTFVDVKDLASPLPNSAATDVTITFLEDFIGDGTRRYNDSESSGDNSYVLVSN